MRQAEQKHSHICTAYMSTAHVFQQRTSGVPSSDPLTRGSPRRPAARTHTLSLCKAPGCRPTSLRRQVASRGLRPGVSTSFLPAAVASGVEGPPPPRESPAFLNAIQFSKNPISLFHVRPWRRVSLDVIYGLVVPDEYLQQPESPVKAVADLTELVCALVNCGVKI